MAAALPFEERYLAAPADDLDCDARAPCFDDGAPCDRAADTARRRRVEEERIIFVKAAAE